VISIIRPELPRLSVPICLLVDDWTVGDVWQEKKDFDRSWEFVTISQTWWSDMGSKARSVLSLIFLRTSPRIPIR